MVNFSMAYGIAEKFRRFFPDSLCLAPNWNTMCQNTALKHRCFQQQYCTAPPSSTQYVKWYITMECHFVFCNCSKYYTLSFNPVRQIRGCSHISLSPVLSAFSASTDRMHSNTNTSSTRHFICSHQQYCRSKDNRLQSNVCPCQRGCMHSSSTAHSLCCHIAEPCNISCRVCSYSCVHIDIGTEILVAYFIVYILYIKHTVSTYYGKVCLSFDLLAYWTNCVEICH